MAAEFRCTARWDVFGLQCELPTEHGGDHLSCSGDSGRIGQWGGIVEYMGRVPLVVGAAPMPTGRELAGR